MGSISFVEGKWRALIRRKGFGSVSKRFDTKSKAAAWMRDIEGQIISGSQKKEVVKSERTMGKVIDAYIRLRAQNRPILDTSTEHYTLKILRKHLGDIAESALSIDDLIVFAQKRRDEGAGAYTVNCDLSKLGTVIRYAGSDGLPDVLGKARPKLTYLKLIGGGGLRERRPTEDEITRILDWLAREKSQLYADFVQFSIMTAMRRGEVCRIAWDDLDHEKKLVLIRDRKDPRQKTGNNQWVPLLNGSWELALSQPKNDERIFPLHVQTVSKYFTEACRDLSIPDLHLHDMRHEGISRMFEHGFDIPRVSIVSGHSSWTHLRRYTNLKPESLHQDEARLSTERDPDSRRSASRQDKSEP